MINKRFIVVVLLVLTLGIIGYEVGLAISHRNKIPISIGVSPTDSVVRLSGKKIHAGTVYISPGDYTFRAEHALFDAVEQKVTVGTTSLRRVILIAPSTSDAAKKWLQDHPSEDATRQQLSAELSNQQGQILVQKNPIIKDLPYIDNTYRIDYGASVKNPNDSNAIAIYIKSTDDNAKQQALDWLKFKGYDPTKLEIYYSSFNGFQ